MGIDDLAGKAREFMSEHGEKVTEAVDKAKDAVGEHGDKIADAVDKATDFIDDKTGHRFTSQLDSVDDKARELLSDKDDEKK